MKTEVRKEVYYEKCESKLTNKKYETKIKKIEILKSKINKLQKELLKWNLKK